VTFYLSFSQKYACCLVFLQPKSKTFTETRSAVPLLSQVSENPLAQKRLKTNISSINTNCDLKSSERVFTFQPSSSGSQWEVVYE